MFLSNTRGIYKAIRRKPQLASVAAANLRRRFRQTVFPNGNGKRTYAPELITVVVTDICNMKCRECHYANTTTDDYRLNRVGGIKREVFEKMIDEAPGLSVVAFTGGEPLLHKEITRLLAYAKKRGHFVTLVTNGWFLEKHAAALCEAGVDLLTVSVEGPEKVHDPIRGKHSFERLVAGIKAVLRQPVRPILMISTAMSDATYLTLPETYEMARVLGVDGLNVNHLWMNTAEMVQNQNQLFPMFASVPVDWEVQPAEVSSDVLADNLETIRQRNFGSTFMLSESPYLNRAEIKTWYEEPVRPVKYKQARCGDVRFRVWPDGKVKPCREWIAGDLNEQSIRDIWAGERYQEFREALNTNGLMPICARCCQLAYR